MTDIIVDDKFKERLALLFADKQERARLLDEITSELVITDSPPDETDTAKDFYKDSPN